MRTESARINARTKRRTLCFVLGVAFVLSDPRALDGLFAQTDVTDADLEEASRGRTITVGSLSPGGRAATLPLEVYVARVLAGEGEPNAPQAAQQALAIAIRTYSIVKTGTHRREGFDLCDTTHCQVPRAATAASRRAALATMGRILAYNGAAAEVFYSASCGGRSESASQIWSGTDFPYLRTIVDDVHDDDEPWTLELRLRDVEQALGRAGFAGRLTDLRIDGHTVSGRVARLRLGGVRPNLVAGNQFRGLIGATRLRSTAFSLTRRGDTLRFTGRGYGHGVGMCVIGAGRRARAGHDAHAILATYYPGLTLIDLDGAQPLPHPIVPKAPGELAAAPRRAAANAVIVRPAKGSAMDDVAQIERVAADAHALLSKRLGTSIAPITVDLHDSVESFRAATGRPWWVSAAIGGTSIDLAPATLVAQREGIDATLRIAMAELLVGSSLADRPAWVRTGAARYFARPVPISPPSSRRRCPVDAELTHAISAATQRDAEARAEACFAHAYAQAGDWRAVR